MLLDFVAQRYGRDRTAQILTFTKFKIKSSIDKICKVLEKKDEKGKVIEYGYKVADEVKEVLKITGDQGKMPDQKDCTYKDMMNISQNPQDYARYGDANLQKFVDASKEFRRLMTKYPLLNEYLKRIEGTIDTSGIHAGGVIISNRPIHLDCPVIQPTDKSKAVLPITMYDYPDCEAIGLLKMDLLRTATLRVISTCIQLIKETTGETIDVYDIGRDDEKTFELMANGETHGLFQIASGGITSYTKRVDPICQEEVIDILALYRPGPLDAVLQNGNTIAEQYIINGSEKELIKYLDEIEQDMRDILESTRGQMVYQEQVMALVQKIAGYNLGHADNFRRVIGKKKIDEMPKLYDEFMYGHKYVIKKWEKFLAKLEASGDDRILVKGKYDGKELEMTKQEIENELRNIRNAMASHEIKGAVTLGFSEKFADNLFRQMAAFAGYAFNKSHSACYADETYQTAWLKKHYPTQFMCALLTVRGEDKDKTLENLKEAKRMGIRILPPNINQSQKEFIPDKGDIRFGLLSIAGVGHAAVDEILAKRPKDGYKSFQEFCTLTSGPVNRGVYRKLIEAGCFDEFEPNRYKLMNIYNFEIRGDKEYQGTLKELELDKKAKSNHSYKYNDKEYNDMRMLEMERELIGVYVSGSPYDGLPYTPLSDMDLSTYRDKIYYDVGGRISNVKIIKTKQNKSMAFVTLDTQLEPLEVTFFPSDYDDIAHHIYKDNIVTIRGYKNTSMYRGEQKEQFIGTKILLKEAKKLKRQMGIEEQKRNQEESEKTNDSLPILEQSKPEPKADPMAELFEGKSKGKKKKAKKKGKIDLDDYMED